MVVMKWLVYHLQWTAVGQHGVRGQNVRRLAVAMELVSASVTATTHYLSILDGHVTATTQRSRPVHRPRTVPVHVSLVIDLYEMQTSNLR